MKFLKKTLAILITAIMLVSVSSGCMKEKNSKIMTTVPDLTVTKSETTSSEEVTDTKILKIGNAKVGDIVEYGSYPQIKVTDSALISTIETLTLDANNNVTYNGTTYKRVYISQYPDFSQNPTTEKYNFQNNNGYYINTVYWFKYVPIKWHILAKENGKALLFSEKILDCKEYHETSGNVTWETSNLRIWLNNDFYNVTFSSSDKTRILTSTIVNFDNPWDWADGGNNTQDKIFLLSYFDVINITYGFSLFRSFYDTARQAQGTDYAKSKGLYVSNKKSYNSTYKGNSYWWLRSNGDQFDGGYVNYDGSFFFNTYTSYYSSLGVRPAFWIKL
jgi:hypothetical protein